MLSTVKKLVKKLPIAFTRNQQYDAQTVQILKQICRKDSACIDVGCHKGEMLDVILKFAPNGQHYCFEPLPHFYAYLTEKNYPTNCHFYNMALSNTTGETQFNFVVSNPPYSGIKQRRFDRAHEEVELITVQMALLDDVLPVDAPIDFIKIDVEGAEMLVLEGAKKTLERCRPVVVFEHGLGGSDIYGTTPRQIFQFFERMGFSVGLMRDFLAKKPPLSMSAFEKQFYDGKNYYFIAYPSKLP